MITTISTVNWFYCALFVIIDLTLKITGKFIMANNYMFLIHKPSKLGVMLGKRMGWGWYGAPEQKLNDFYEYLSNKRFEERQDDFILAMEDCDNSGCFDDWRHTGEKENGFLVFEYT